MTSHVGCIDVGNGHVEPGTRATYFFGRRHDSFSVAQNLAHGIAPRHVPQCAVLDFTSRADDGSLAVALHNFGISTQCSDQGARHFETQRLEVVHESGDLLYVAPGKRIADDRQGGGTTQRHGGSRSSLVEYLLHGRELFSNLDLRHERDSRTIGTFLERLAVPNLSWDGTAEAVPFPISFIFAVKHNPGQQIRFRKYFYDSSVATQVQGCRTNKPVGEK